MPAAGEWDARYASREGRLWSGCVNGSLIAEVEGLAPGRALDVGCGEGADAIWLAGAGWGVTGLDVSAVAIERAAAAAAAAGVTVEWVVGDLAEVAPTGFDLVSLHYPALPPAALDPLLGAVAPGGTLLVVGHAGVHKAGYIQPQDVRARLTGWTVEVEDVRPRVDAPAGAHHHDDEIIRARRPGGGA